MIALTKEEKVNMGRTMVQIKVENAGDLTGVKRGYITFDKIRHIEAEALVDTGASTLCLPPEMVKALGLSLIDTKRVKTGAGEKNLNVYETVQLTILGRTCRVDVFEIPHGIQPLVGYIPLEWLDLVVDPKKGKVTPNPEHGDEMILDLL